MDIDAYGKQRAKQIAFEAVGFRGFYVAAYRVTLIGDTFVNGHRCNGWPLCKRPGESTPAQSFIYL